MIVTCEKCGNIFNDVTVSTCCPHRGIGYCRACDCAMCVCSPDTKDARSNAYRERE